MKAKPCWRAHRSRPESSVPLPSLRLFKIPSRVAGELSPHVDFHRSGS
jgi:hypothetical protein